MKRLLALLFFAAAAVAQQVNPHTQIRWPAECAAPGMVYNFQSNTCIDTQHVDPGHVTWPPSCTSGVYSPATNTCVPVGAAANPGGSNGQLQINSAGIFGGVSLNGGLFVDGVGALNSTGVLSSAYGLSFLGDSNTAGFGVTAGQDYPSLMAADLGGVTKNNYAISGDNWADCAYRTLTSVSTTDFANPATMITCGTNNSRFVNAPIPASYSQTAQQEMAAAFFRLATSNQQDQIYFTNGTIWTQTSGTWIKEMPWFLMGYAAGHLGSGYCDLDVLSLTGTGMQFTIHTNTPTGGAVNGGVQINLNGDAIAIGTTVTTVVSSPLSCSGSGAQMAITAVGQVPVLAATGSGSVTTTQNAEVMAATGTGVLTGTVRVGPSGTVAVTYPVGPAYGGSFQVLIDGTPAADIFSGATTFSEAWGASETVPNNAPNTAQILSASLQGQGAKAAVFSGLAVGSHTVAISIVSGKVGVSHLTSPHGVVNWGNNAPHAGVGGTIYEKNNAQAANVTAWNSLTASTVQTLRTKAGLNLIFVNLNDGLDSAMDLINSGSAIGNCQPNTDSSTGVHLAFGSCGHAIVAREFEQGMKIVAVQTAPQRVGFASTTYVASNSAPMPSVSNILLSAASAQTFTLFPSAFANQVIKVENTGVGVWTIACSGGATCTSVPASLPGTSLNAAQGSWMLCNAIGTQWFCQAGNGVDASNSVNYGPLKSVCSTVGGCTLAKYIEYSLVSSTVGAGSTMTLPAINTMQTGHPITIDNISGFPLTLSIPSSGTMPTTLGIGCTITFSVQNQASNVYRILGSSCPMYTGTTGTITGSALTNSCNSGTVTVTGAAAGDPVSVSSTTGADVGGAFYLRGSVTSANTVTVYVCGNGTPASLAYNVVVNKMRQ